ncbi:hypothetical protein SEA_CAELUM_75 [Streptomyces phage Caelum]|uniref:Uncharacterized protein n=1 Tax=Streptomyces phage Caelum TaxID=2530160 RepID=A0A481W096_9CAUD|nr:hypothetical protein KGG86_gp75 [Streptomyces phage Caelum]QBI99435.1 hypothetical protein SEA_CAELUM_75 [Streptomyces phage Caelum]
MPYTVEWTETSQHKRELTDEEMAALKGVTVEELAELDEDELTDGLEEELAALDDDGFEGLERDVDECIKH